MVALVAACGSSSNGASPGGGDGGTPADAGHGDASDGGSGNPDPGCTVTATGTSGIALKATLLVPGGPMDGEVFVDGTGKIACAAASCSSAAGYSSATRIACTNAVVVARLRQRARSHRLRSPRRPRRLATTRYQHRNEWRTGADGATPSRTAPTTTRDRQRDGRAALPDERRHVARRARAASAGLTRNLAEYNNPARLEGLTGHDCVLRHVPARRQQRHHPRRAAARTRHRLDPERVRRAAACSPRTSPKASTPAPRTRSSAPTPPRIGLVTRRRRSSTPSGRTRRTSPRSQAAGAKRRLGAALEHQPLRQHHARHRDASTPASRSRSGTDWLPSGSMNMLRELSCADALNSKYFARRVHRPAARRRWRPSTRAAAMGFGSQIGTIAAGMLADLVSSPRAATRAGAPSSRRASEDVALVLRGGKVALRRRAARAGRDGHLVLRRMTVCGTSKSVCLDVPRRDARRTSRPPRRRTTRSSSAAGRRRPTSRAASRTATATRTAPRRPTGRRRRRRRDATTAPPSSTRRG